MTKRIDLGYRKDSHARHSATSGLTDAEKNSIVEGNNFLLDYLYKINVMYLVTMLQHKLHYN